MHPFKSVSAQVLIVGVSLLGLAPANGQALQGTQALTDSGDIASEMVAGIDRFLLKQLQAARTARKQLWSNGDAANGMREKLSEMLGVVQEERPNQIRFEKLRLDETEAEFAVDGVTVEFVRWGAIRDPSPQTPDLVSVHGEGILLTPAAPPKARVVAMPNAGVALEHFAGIDHTHTPELRIPLELAQAGCQVIIPTLIDRSLAKRNGRSNLTNREYLHRSAFELGRHLIGLELQKIFALVDYWTHQEATPIAVYGEGDGGMLAYYAGALDERVSATAVVGYFGPREDCWQEPLDRNVFSRLKYFGDAELAQLISPRSLIIGNYGYPAIEINGQGGAPSQLKPPEQQRMIREIEDASQHFEKSRLRISLDPRESYVALLRSLGIDDQGQAKTEVAAVNLPELYQQLADSRQTRQIQELDRHIQALLRESEFVRKDFLAKLDTSSLAEFENSVEQYRSIFREEVIGQFDLPLSLPNARSRKSWSSATWDGYEIKLDVFPDVFAYGALLVPKDLKPSEKRPVVVCQHGLEGRPTDTFLGDHRAYHDFAGKLCERGFIIFCPQNPYIFTDRFRTLQRKANPLGKTLFSIIVPQHRQIVNWLKDQDFVDPDRIAFYGLSYGGKSAMRIPALVTDYCLSICSADFNEWVLKNASTRHRFSYVWTGEYEIFEWNLGRTFNYFEMASLICPRPFMVERGHFDGVGTDEWVAFEYAKVRHLYAAKLKIPERTEIEWFDGPHTIHGKGTFEFLHRHLDWPLPNVSSN